MSFPRRLVQEKLPGVARFLRRYRAWAPLAREASGYLLRGDVDQCLRKIHQGFVLSIDPISALVLRRLGDSLDRDMDHSDLAKVSEQLVSTISGMDAGTDVARLLGFSKVMGACGFLSVGDAIREKAKEAAIGRRAASRSGGMARAQALLENGALDACAAQVSRLSRGGVAQPVVEGFSRYLALVDPASKHQARAPGAGMLAAFLTGKSVAVVGPAETGRDQGEEIDRFDHVLRIGFVGLQSIPASGGARTSGAFYADHKIDALLGGTIPEGFRDLEMFVLATAKYREQLKLWGIPDEAMEEAAEMGQLFFYTKPNAVQHLVWSCLLNGAGRLKMFNSNLFLSQKYPDGYLQKTEYCAKGPEMDAPEYLRNWCHSFAFHHNPRAQFSFLQRLVEAQVIEVDTELSGVLEMDAKTYIARLDQIYGYASW